MFYFQLIKLRLPKLDYQTTKDQNLLEKHKRFPKLTTSIFVEKKEVKQYDNYSIVDKMIDTTKEPHKLHLIKKTKTIVGEPNWVRDALQKLGFFRSPKKEWRKIYSVKPNTPQINDLLWLCKHCVKVTPINMENGEPTLPDIGYTNLNLQTGKFDIIHKLNATEIDNNECFKVNDVLVTPNKDLYETFPLHKKELLRYIHRRKELKQLNSEYFPTVQKYRLDQDKPGVINIKGTADTRVSEDE